MIRDTTLRVGHVYRFSNTVSGRDEVVFVVLRFDRLTASVLILCECLPRSGWRVGEERRVCADAPMILHAEEIA